MVGSAMLNLIAKSTRQQELSRTKRQAAFMLN